MDYIGSKFKLNPWIFDKVTRHFPIGGVFMDACCGSGSVSRYAASRGFEVLSTDILHFPQYVIGGSICRSADMAVNQEAVVCVVEGLTNAPPAEGFFYHNYSEEAQRPYFSNANAKKIDGCRRWISEQADGLWKSRFAKCYAIYCLLEAMSRVANTAGTHVSFLKELKYRAQQPLHIAQMPVIKGVADAFQGDVLTLIESEVFRTVWQPDILYIDPPYNERQYAPYYHLYETLVRYDDPKLTGVTGQRDYTQEKSQFCSKKSCLSYTKELIEASSAKLILISYSSDGIMPLNELEKMLVDTVPSGEITIHVKSQRRYRCGSEGESNDSSLREYLFEVVRPPSII